MSLFWVEIKANIVKKFHLKHLDFFRSRSERISFRKHDCYV